MGNKRSGKEIKMETVVQRNPEQQFSKIDDEVVMLSLEHGQYYALNSVASRIWEIIGERRTVKEITETLMEEFEVDDETCLKDTLACLYDFRDKSLITEA